MSPSNHQTRSETVEIALEDHEADPTSITKAIADVIADVEGVDVTDVEPLYYSINTEALDALFETQAEDTPQSRRFTFTHQEYTITIDTNPELTVTLTRS